VTDAQGLRILGRLFRLLAHLARVWLGSRLLPEPLTGAARRHLSLGLARQALRILGLDLGVNGPVPSHGRPSLLLVAEGSWLEILIVTALTGARPVLTRGSLFLPRPIAERLGAVRWGSGSGGSDDGWEKIRQGLRAGDSFTLPRFVCRGAADTDTFPKNLVETAAAAAASIHLVTLHHDGSYNALPGLQRAGLFEILGARSFRSSVTFTPPMESTEDRSDFRASSSAWSVFGTIRSGGRRPDTGWAGAAVSAA
jgi:hypothetical protein